MKKIKQNKRNDIMRISSTSIDMHYIQWNQICTRLKVKNLYCYTLITTKLVGNHDPSIHV